MVAAASAVHYIDQAARLDSARIPVAEQPALFLRTLWRALPTHSLVSLAAQTAYITHGQWHATMNSEWRWLDAAGCVIDDLVRWAGEQNARPYALPGMGSIFYNAAARKHEVIKRQHARGGLNDLTYVTALWCDLDCAKRGYDLAAGLDALLALPLKPTFVVFSGGGLQAVHVLREAWPVPHREAAVEYRSTSLAFYQTAFDRTGLTLDKSVHDAAREMRLPGFVNRKPERHGAVACILYFDLDAQYSITEIRRAAPLLPPRPRLVEDHPVPPDGLYGVSQEFVRCLIDEPQVVPAERHPQLVHLALVAARAGIPQDSFREHLRQVAQGWYIPTGEAHRAAPHGELDSLVDWAYARIAEEPDAVPAGHWLVRLTADGFERAAVDEQERLLDRTVVLDMALENPVRQSLPDVRREQALVISRYLRERVARGIGTYLLLQTPPGVGKTHSALQAVQRAVQEYSELAAVLTLFKFEEQGWRAYVESFGIDPELCFYLVARNADPASAGYCALAAQAESVAKKNWNVQATLCARCPHHMQCEQDWYLSQYVRAKNRPIILARHQHGLIQQLIEYRKIIVFDESPLPVVAAPIILAPEDMTFTGGPVFHQDQYKAAVKLLARFVEALRSIVGSNPAPTKGEFTSRQHVRLGGRWLFDRLHDALGDSLNNLILLDEKIVKNSGKAGIPDLTPDSIAALPVNYLLDLWKIIRYEYQTHYAAGKTVWNSRLVPVGGTLHLYRMEPFAFSQNTSIIITDATGQPELYGKALADIQGRRRVGHVFDAALEKRARIIQFTGAENTRTTFRSTVKRPRKSAQQAVTIATADGQEITLNPDDLNIDDNTAIAQSKVLIAALAAQFEQSLLVVTYKDTVQRKLAAWAKEVGVLPPEHIQWFGSLRGKNDYKHLAAALVIGTPRIQEMDLLAQAQAWHWSDDLPIDDTRMVRVLPYGEYHDPTDGKARGYRYIGYRDDRVDALYTHLIAAEIRQDYERIRPDTSDGERTVFLATPFPASDHVEELVSWLTWHIDQAARTLIEQRLKAGQEAWESELVPALMRKAECSKSTARRAVRRMLPLVSAELGARSRMRPIDRVLAWFAEDPTRRDLPVSQIAKTLGVSPRTVDNAKAKARQS